MHQIQIWAYLYCQYVIQVIEGTLFVSNCISFSLRIFIVIHIMSCNSLYLVLFLVFHSTSFIPLQMIQGMRLRSSPTNCFMSLQLLTLRNTGELLMWSCFCGQPRPFPCSKHVADDMTCFEPEAGGYRVEGILFHKFYFNNGKEMRLIN